MASPASAFTSAHIADCRAYVPSRSPIANGRMTPPDVASLTDGVSASLSGCADAIRTQAARCAVSSRRTLNIGMRMDVGMLIDAGVFRSVWSMIVLSLWALGPHAVTLLCFVCLSACCGARRLSDTVSQTVGAVSQTVGGLTQSVDGLKQKILSGVISPTGYAEALRTLAPPHACDQATALVLEAVALEVVRRIPAQN